MRPAAPLASLVLAAAVAGCHDQRLRWEAERAVRAYDDALAAAYRMSDASRLKPVAGVKEMGRVQVLIDLKRASGLVLESQLESFTLTSARAAGRDGLVARTLELWRYHDRATRPGQPPGRLFVAEMEMEWELARAGGDWRVEKGRTLSSRYLEPKGFVPGPEPAPSRAAETGIERGEAAP